MLCDKESNLYRQCLICIYVLCGKERSYTSNVWSMPYERKLGYVYVFQGIGMNSIV